MEYFKIDQGLAHDLECVQYFIWLQNLLVLEHGGFSTDSAVEELSE